MATSSRSASKSSSSRASSSARTQVLAQLKEDHKRVKKAYRDFQKMDAEEDPEGCEELVNMVLDELTLHATLEEELLYPAARGAIAEEDLVDEAEIEHESAKILIEQLRQMSPADEKYAARFTVLCEYVLHHVKEEESEMFPQLERARLDWEGMAQEMEERRAALGGVEQEGEEEEDGEEAGTGSASRRMRSAATVTEDGGGSDDADDDASSGSSSGRGGSSNRR